MKTKTLSYKVLSKLRNIKQWQPILSLFIFIFSLTTFPSLASNNSQVSSIATASKIVQDNKGFIWLAGQQGLTRFDGEQTITFNSGNANWSIPFHWLHDVTIDKEKLLLATETDGLWQFTPKTGQVNKILADIPQQSYYDVISFEGNY